MVYRYGSFWRRALAIIIDRFIISFLYLALLIGEFAFTSGHSFELLRRINGPFLIGHILLGYILGAVYFTWFHGTTGQTPGKILLKLKVISVRRRELTYFMAFIRFLGYLLSALALFLGFLWAAFDPKKQAWHDKIAGTVVIMVNVSAGDYEIAKW